jgi:hypothetical protein
MNGVFVACDISKFCGNTKQFLEAETKLLCIIHLKAFIFKLDVFY